MATAEASVIPLTPTLKKLYFFEYNGNYQQYITEATIDGNTYQVVQQGEVNNDWVVVEDISDVLRAERVIVTF